MAITGLPFAMALDLIPSFHLLSTGSGSSLQQGQDNHHATSIYGEQGMYADSHSSISLQRTSRRSSTEPHPEITQNLPNRQWALSELPHKSQMGLLQTKDDQWHHWWVTNYQVDSNGYKTLLEEATFGKVTSSLVPKPLRECRHKSSSLSKQWSTSWVTEYATSAED